MGNSAVARAQGKGLGEGVDPSAIGATATLGLIQGLALRRWWRIFALANLATIGALLKAVLAGQGTHHWRTFLLAGGNRSGETRIVDDPFTVCTLVAVGLTKAAALGRRRRVLALADVTAVAILLEAIGAFHRLEARMIFAFLLAGVERSRKSRVVDFPVTARVFVAFVLTQTVAGKQWRSNLALADVTAAGILLEAIGAFHCFKTRTILTLLDAHRDRPWEAVDGDPVAAIVLFTVGLTQRTAVCWLRCLRTFADFAAVSPLFETILASEQAHHRLTFFAAAAAVVKEDLQSVGARC